MKQSSVATRLNVGHLGLLLLFVVGTLVFLTDTLSQSFRLENVIVILPVSALVIVLCVVQAIRHVFKREPIGGEANDSSQLDLSPTNTDPPSLRDQFKIPLFMVLLGVYILGLIYVAFDLSTFLFLFLALVIQGEKRLVFGAVYSFALAWALTWGLKYMVSFPFNTLFF